MEPTAQVFILMAGLKLTGAFISLRTELGYLHDALTGDVQDPGAIRGIATRITESAGTIRNLAVQIAENTTPIGACHP